jgi:hypothetical protein
MLGRNEKRLVDALGELTRLLLLSPVKPNPLEWIESAINLDKDATAATGGLVKMDAWQRPIVAAQFDPDVRQIIVSAVEQIGKSSCWKWPQIYRMIHAPSPELVLFESEVKSEDINQRTIKPIVESLPELRAMLTRENATKGGYLLGNGAVIDFAGAGTNNITSKPYRIAICDELDRYGSYSAAMQQLRDARKRLRTYRNKSLLVVACSPLTEGGGKSPTWEQFEGTDKAYWTLRCLGCGELTMRSCDIYHLQFDRSEEGEIIPTTLRLECPVCGHQHREVSAQECTDRGAYVAKHPEITDRRGFQVGSLAVPRVFSWWDIAQAQIKAGASSDLRTQEDFDNSWRGIAWRKRKANDSTIARRQVDYVEVNTSVKHALFSADTQDDCYYWVVRGFDSKQNTYLLGNGKAANNDELETAWRATYRHGRCCVAGIVDHGGHRPRDVETFVKGKSNCWAYKGNPSIGVRWKLSKECDKLVLANPKIYQRELLYSIYNKPIAGDYDWYLPLVLDDEYLEHIRSLHPPKLLKDRGDYDRWVPNGADHYFDAEKMWLVLREIVVKKYGLGIQTATQPQETTEQRQEAIQRSLERRRQLRRENDY